VTVKPPDVDGIAVVTLDHFPVNSLSANVYNGCTRAIRSLEADPQCRGVVVVGAGRMFCGGADISAFGKASAPREPMGRPVTDFLGFEGMAVPVVAAIHGFALGGGLEAALGCHYRVMDGSAKLGLPEVNIGLLPGGQGTQRLPRLIGPDAAIEMMTSGAHIGADQALKWKVVDTIVAKGSDLLSTARAVCKSKMGLPLPKICDMPPPQPTDFAKATAKLAKMRPGEIAPAAIVRCVEAACAGPTFAVGDKVEKREFGVLLKSPESAALRHMFFAERTGVKVDGIRAKAAKISTVGIVGAGLMGGGIAMSCAEVGIVVKLVDVSEAGLAKGLKMIHANFDRSRRLSVDQKAQFKGRITGSTALTSLADCDMVVEAVFEDMDVKKEIFAELDRICKPSAFLCSNTSYLSIDEIASVTSRPERVMGTHFFSPANVMKLLENVRGAKTSDHTVATMMAWGKRIGKWCILVGNCHGFVGNRMVDFYSKSAKTMLGQGLLPEEIDGAAQEFGMRVGPLVMADIVGIDLGIQAIKKRGQYDPHHVVAHALIEAGRLGQKSKAGYYDYKDGRTPIPSAEAAAIVRQVAKNCGMSAVTLSNDGVVRRLLFPMINEAFKILEEGVAQRPSDIDVCYVHGYSFPRHRGGPLFFADRVGLSVVKTSLEDMGITPAPLLLQCVAAGKTLAKHWADRSKVTTAKL